MFETELEYFKENQTELVSKYKGKTLVIKDRSVVDVGDDPLAAYLKATKKYAPGTFMLQPCIEGADAYTVTITSHELFV